MAAVGEAVCISQQDCISCPLLHGLSGSYLQLVHGGLADVHQLADVVPNAGYVALDGVLHPLCGHDKRLTHHISNLW